MIAVAYLRVYTEAEEPMPAHEPGGVEFLDTEYGVVGEALTDDAFVADWQGRRMQCPRFPRLRMLEGLLAFHNAYPSLVGPTLVPEAVMQRAATELQELYERRPGARSHILTSPWHVPLRWFAAFRPDQREVVDVAGHTSIRYRTSRRKASHRLERTVAVLQRAEFEESIVEPVQHLVEWLDEFPADAMVELDYGSVAELFDDYELVLDTTAADVAASIAALDAGDFEEAGMHYAAAATRWAASQALSFAN